MQYFVQRNGKNIRSLIVLFLLFQYSVAQNEKEIKINASTSEIVLSGTICLPTDLEISSAVVLLPVAGPTDRDLSLGNHKYYKTLADGLAKKGIASIRYDDRGVGGSTGEFLQSSLEDRTKDACMAMDVLKKELKEVEAFGFIGMSEGAGISVLASQSCDPVSYVVLLSMPVRKGRVEMENQMSRLLASSFFTDEQKKAIENEAKAFIKLADSPASDTRRDDILNLLKGKYGQVILPPYHFVPKTPEEKADFVLSPWYQSQLKYNIQDALLKSDIPALAIYGELDKAIDPKANSELLKKLSPQTTIKELKGINHLMQEAKSGSPMEYLMLPTSFSAEIIDLITSWITKL